MTFADWIGIAAFLIAIPPILQMYGGRPTITVQFMRHSQDEMTTLYAAMFNYPVSNKLMRFVNVRRETPRVTTWVSVTRLEPGDRQVVLTTSRGWLVDSGNAVQLDLPPGIIPIKVVVAWGAQDGAHALDNDGKPVMFPAGQYEAEVVNCVAEVRYHSVRQFVVTADSKDLYWVEAQRG
jgi:hypothetical protein